MSLILKKLFFLKVEEFYLNKFFFIEILKKRKVFFFKHFIYLKFFFFLINKYKFIKFQNLNFIWYKFSLFFGLGYKKKISKTSNFLYVYVGDRHWLILKIPFSSFFFTFKRRNFICFTNSKQIMYFFNNLLKELKKISIFKLKGFVDARTIRRWLFVRRLKVRGVKLKLSKKQKLV